MTKIKSLTISGLRGIKEPLTFELNTNSMLLYGDNGSGKSSITDACEWFYHNQVKHLSDEEIGRRGLEALRNVFLNNEEKGTAAIAFTNDIYNSERNIFYKKETLQSEHSNLSKEFSEYLDASQKENLVLRYKDLVNFILATKKEKLDSLSEIIGFSEVSKVRETLRKIVGDLKREFKKCDFDNKINSQQKKLIDYFNCNITSDDQFIAVVNESVKPLEMNTSIHCFDEIDAFINLVKNPENVQAIELQSLYEKISDWACHLPAVLDKIEYLYEEYHKQFRKIIDDIEKINKILLEKLLTEGAKLIKENVVSNDQCPLCLQPKNRFELLKELDNRITELEVFKLEKVKLDELKESLKRELKDPVQKINYYLSERHLKTEENRDLAAELSQLMAGFEVYADQVKIEILPAQKLKMPGEIAFDKQHLNQISDLCRQKGDILKESKKDDPAFAIQRKILLAREAYLDIKKLKKEKAILERQQQSVEAIYSEFLKTQKGALETFLTHFSGEVDEFYQFMNPAEKIEAIKLIPLEKDDELIGLTLEFKFHNNPASPPHRYLSESHLNCLGIAFFLTSVKAFNKINKFFILDDVISSFDSNHRKRFADLLIEKFSDYQVIIMTHELNWFENINNNLKNKNWVIKTLTAIS
ncbi:MAG TPA: hypothetical protein VK186_27705 [Candidatus Deferrimicrobium sp.]|nr:hypothetical protein [Candidatus Deferrimicrobium sp.]